MAKKYFTRLGVEFEIKDRAEYADEMMALGGRITTPLIRTEKGITYGYNPMEISSLL
jgi:arsenate reductase-like glutaredoxin family protein